MAMRELEYYHTLLNRWRRHLHDFMNGERGDTGGAPWVFVQACDELVSEVERLRNELDEVKRHGDREKEEEEPDGS